MSDQFWKYIGVLVTIGGLILGAGRFVGKLEQRIEQLERNERWLHGTVEAPTPRR